MLTYVVGDIQGCFIELKALLETIQFNPRSDHLWCVGDLVNRGPQSLDVLRFIYQLPHRRVVLGNHDLHFLAVASGVRSTTSHDTLDALLVAPELGEWVDWLRQQPLIYHSSQFDRLLVHAGIPPQWSWETALAAAHEVEAALQGPDYSIYLQQIYGNEPNVWDAAEQGWSRLRYITNALTRLRFCTLEGDLELIAKGKAIQSPVGCQPWYVLRDQLFCGREPRIIFGHWAALQGEIQSSHCIALDTGCVWGGALTALRLEDGQKFSVSGAVV